MKADQAIERVREWRGYNYGPHLPSAVVIAETDWLAYVQAMTATLPDEDLAYPAEEDVLWAWPEGVLIVFAAPVEIQHTIVSRSIPGGMVTETMPIGELQSAAALCITRKQLVPTQLQGKVPMEPVTAYPTMWIGSDPSDIVQGHWLPGTTMRPAATKISESTLMLVSMITALGHRLTRIAQPSGSRGERRRAERELPGLRVLELASGASVQHSTSSSINYTRRWMVRGHWRLQPYGPERSLRKPIWIDPYVKGPEDKPLDVRDTLWRRR